MAIRIDVIEDDKVIDTYNGIRCSVGGNDDIVSNEILKNWIENVIKAKLNSFKKSKTPDEVDKEYSAMIEFCEKYMDNNNLSFRLYDA